MLQKLHVYQIQIYRCDVLNCLMIAMGVYLMTGKNQHVVPHPEGWAVKGARNSRATAVYSTQKDAIARAEQIARNQGSDTKIHGENGKIRAGNSYGNDPCPPKDKK